MQDEVLHDFSTFTDGHSVTHAGRPASHCSALPGHSLLNGFDAHDEVLSPHCPDPAPDVNPGNGCSRMSVSDWDLLFCAIQDRLAHCVADPSERTPATPALAPPEPDQVTRTTVLQCVEAMQQLHAALTIERHEARARRLVEAL